MRSSRWKAVLSDFATLNELHLDPDTRMYADWGNDTAHVTLKRVRLPGSQTETLRRRPTKAFRADPPRPRHVPHYGYVSLFPLITRLIPPTAPQLGVELTRLREEGKLWTAFGLRSLSADSTLYMKKNSEHEHPYWRGSVWININYLVLASLRHYAHVEGPFQVRAAERAHLRTALTVEHAHARRSNKPPSCTASCGRASRPTCTGGTGRRASSGSSTTTRARAWAAARTRSRAGPRSTCSCSPSSTLSGRPRIPAPPATS